MIKAVFLIFAPVATWERIFRAQRSLLFVLGCFLLPMMVISAAGEAYGLIHWGKWQGELAREPKKFSVGQAAVFEAMQFVLTFIVILVNAALLRSIGGTFHGRHTFAQTFTATAYGLSPLFLLRLLNASSDVPSWLPWAVGIVLSLAVLYHGVPTIMQPDPAHAFGLYFTNGILLVFTTGLLELVLAMYLQGEFPKLDSFISSAAARLPF